MFSRSDAQQQQAYFTYIINTSILIVQTEGAVNGTELLEAEPREVIIEDVDERYGEFLEENIQLYEKLHRMRIRPMSDLNIIISQQIHLHCRIPHPATAPFFVHQFQG